MPDRPDRPTLSDVAKAAFVSRPTASVAFTGRGRIDPQTREHVVQIAREMGYRPNLSARYFRGSGRAPLVAAAFSDMPDGSRVRTPRVFWVRAITAFISELGRDGISTVVIPRVSEANVELLPIEAMIAVGLDAKELAALDSIVEIVPIIAGGSTPNGPGVVAQLDPQYGAGIAAALDHLVDQGSERPALLLTDQPLSPMAVLEDAYDSWCFSHGVGPLRVRADDVGESMRDLILSGADSAIVAVDDRPPELEQVLDAITRAGLSIPGDFKLVLIADGLRGQMATPVLTTLDWSGRQAGVLAARVIRMGLETGVYEGMPVPFELISREAHAPS